MHNLADPLHAIQGLFDSRVYFLAQVWDIGSLKSLDYLPKSGFADAGVGHRAERRNQLIQGSPRLL